MLALRRLHRLHCGMPEIEAGMRDLRDGSAKDGKLEQYDVLANVWDPWQDLGGTHGKRTLFIRMHLDVLTPTRGRLQGGRLAERAHSLADQVELSIGEGVKGG